MDEAELVGAARGGDRQAFDELVRRTFVDTFTLARRLTGNEEDARDVVQEAYFRAWKGIGKFRGDAAFSTWMYRITANAASTHVHKRRRQRTEPFADDFEPADDARRAAQLAEAAESAEALDRIADALDELPAKLRTCRRPEGRVRAFARGDRRRARHHGRRRRRCACTGRAGSCATCCTTKETRPMRCDEVTALLPGARRRRADRPRGRRSHIETCLRCQAELARYRRLLRTLVVVADALRRADAGAARRDARRDHRRRRTRRAPHAAVGSPARVRRCDRRRRTRRGGDGRSADRPFPRDRRSASRARFVRGREFRYPSAADARRQGLARFALRSRRRSTYSKRTFAAARWGP